MMVLLSESEQAYIRQGCWDDCRVDGRTRNDYDSGKTIFVVGGGGGDPTTTNDNKNDNDTPHSSLSPSLGLLPLCHGSGRFRSNDLEMLCSIKAQILLIENGNPSLDAHPSSSLQVHFDYAHTLHQQHQSQTSTTIKQTLDQWQSQFTSLVLSCSENQILQDYLRIPSTITTRDKDSATTASQYQWQLTVDFLIVTINGGTILEAASHLLRAVLRETILPALETMTSSTTPSTASTSHTTSRIAPPPQLLVNSDIRQAQNIPWTIVNHSVPMIVTVYIMECGSSDDNVVAQSKNQSFVLLLDATPQEEACAYAIVHFAVIPSSSSSSLSFHTNTTTTNMPYSICGVQTQTTSGAIPLSLLPTLSTLALQAIPQSQQAYRTVKLSKTKNQAIATSSPRLLQEHYLLSSN